MHSLHVHTLGQDEPTRATARANRTALTTVCPHKRCCADRRERERGVQIELDLDTGAALAAPERPSEAFAVIDTGLWECKSCQYVKTPPPANPPPPLG